MRPTILLASLAATAVAAAAVLPNPSELLDGSVDLLPRDDINTNNPLLNGEGKASLGLDHLYLKERDGQVLPDVDKDYLKKEKRTTAMEELN